MSIKAEKLSRESFGIFGHYADIVHPEGPSMGGEAFRFYRDPIRMDVSGRMPVSMSPLAVKKPDEYKAPCLEYHDYTAEVMVMMDDDFVLCVAPANGESEPAADGISAFIVPKGTAVHLNPGVWHYVPLPLAKDTGIVMIILPERTYRNDITVVDSDIKIEL